MKTIVFCTDSLNIGGIEKALLSLIKVIYKKNEYKIKLCIKDYEKNYLEEFIPEGIEYMYLTREKKERYYFNFLEKKYIYKKFKKFIEAGDIIIDYYDGNFYKWFKKIKDKKRIVYFHTIFDKLYISKKKDIIENLKEAYDEFVVLSEGAKEELKLKGIDSKKIDKLYNILDIDEILEKSQKRENLSQEDKELLLEDYYITIGRIVNDSKDYETIIKAFEQINKKLYIVGDGDYRKTLEEIVKNKGLEKKIKFLGKRKNPYIWLKNSKALILSSRYEGLPTVILEAMALNKSIVSTDCPYGPREILGDNEYGELYSVENAEELKKKIKILEYKKYNLKERVNDFGEEKQYKEFKRVLESME